MQIHQTKIILLEILLKAIIPMFQLNLLILIIVHRLHNRAFCSPVLYEIYYSIPANNAFGLSSYDYYFIPFMASKFQMTWIAVFFCSCFIEGKSRNHAVLVFCSFSYNSHNYEVIKVWWLTDYICYKGNDEKMVASMLEAVTVILTFLVIPTLLCLMHRRTSSSSHIPTTTIDNICMKLT